MKESEIKIRLPRDLKLKFKNKCECESITMSNKICNFISNDVNLILDGIFLESNNSIRIILVKSIVTKLLSESLFEQTGNFKDILELALRDNLGFETIVSNIKNENNICYGNVIFKLENNIDYSVNFNIIYNHYEL